MKDGRKKILKDDSEELKKLKFKINYRVVEHIDHSCTLCYKQIIYDDIDMCDGTDKWFATDTFGVCELWTRTPSSSDFKKKKN